eukprot:6492208-Pyramimonas_sp.AAC.1
MGWWGCAKRLDSLRRPGFTSWSLPPVELGTGPQSDDDGKFSGGSTIQLVDSSFSSYLAMSYMR